MPSNLRYETPVQSVEVLLTAYLTNTRPSDILRLIGSLLLKSSHSIACKYILAELLTTQVVSGIINEINMPFLPLVVDRFASKYAISGKNIAMKKEHIVFVLSALRAYDESIFAHISADDISDSMFWLLYQQTRNTHCIVKAISQKDTLFAETLLHHHGNRRKHVRLILYWMLCRQQSDNKKSGNALSMIIRQLKDEIAWIELTDLYYWLKENHIHIRTADYMDVAWVFFQMGNYEEALAIYQKTWEQTKNEEAFRKLVRCMERQGAWEEAIQLAQTHFDDVQDTFCKARLLRTLGWCYVIGGYHRSAIRVSLMAMQLLDVLPQRRDDVMYQIARTHNNLGVGYELSGNLDLSMKHHRRSQRIMKKLRAWKWVSGSALNMAVVLRKNKQFSASRQQADQARKIKTSIMDFDEMPVVHFNEAFSLLLLFFEKTRRSFLSDALELLLEAFHLRSKQHSTKQLAAIIALGYLVTKLFLRYNKEPNGTTKTADDTNFLQTIKQIREEDMATYEHDKTPLIAKALAVHQLCSVQQVSTSLMQTAREEQELPPVPHLVQMVTH